MRLQCECHSLRSTLRSTLIRGLVSIVLTYCGGPVFATCPRMTHACHKPSVSIPAGAYTLKTLSLSSDNTTHVSKESSIQDRNTAAETPSGLRSLFFGPNGIRAGWRVLIFFAVTVPLVLLLQWAAKLSPILKAAARNNMTGGASVPLGDIVLETTVLLPILVAAWVMSRIEHRPFGDYGLSPRNAFAKQFWQGASWGIATEAFAILLIAAFHGFSFGPLALGAGDIAKYAVLWAIAFLLVGLQEEFFCRGYMLYTLATGIRFWPAAIVTSLIFGAGHLFNRGENWIGALEIVLWGLVACLTLRLTGNLWFAVGFHTAGDWAETFLLSVSNSGTPAKGQLLSSTMHGPAWLTGGAVGPEASVFSYVTVLLFAFVFYILYRKPGSQPG